MRAETTWHSHLIWIDREKVNLLISLEWFFNVCGEVLKRESSSSLSPLNQNKDFNSRWNQYICIKCTTHTWCVRVWNRISKYKLYIGPIVQPMWLYSKYYAVWWEVFWLYDWKKNVALATFNSRIGSLYTTYSLCACYFNVCCTKILSVEKKGVCYTTKSAELLQCQLSWADFCVICISIANFAQSHISQCINAFNSHSIFPTIS